MKKVLIFALLASSGFGLSGCLKEVGSSPDPATPTRLTIRLEGVGAPATRALEAPGSTEAGTIQLRSGHIFVFNQAGEVVYSELLNVEQAWINRAGEAPDGEGQTLDTEVPANAQVYILGNIPGADQAALTRLQNFSQIAAYASSIATQNVSTETQSSYTQVALANFDYSPKPIEVDADNDGATTVHVTLAPLLARMELGKVVGGTSITSFTVTGVYVDDWHRDFTYIGGGSSEGGLPYSQGKSTLFDNNDRKDEGSWPAAGAKTSTPGTGTVWAHQVAAGNTPRLLIRVENVQGTGNDNDGMPVSPSKTYYLTVAGYSNLSTRAFAPGVIYRVGGDKGLVFETENLDTEPNPENITVSGLTVDVQEWKIENIEPEL